MRNRTQTFQAMNAMEGLHRIKLMDEAGRLYCVYECVQYAPVYRKALEMLVMSARLIECGAARPWLPVQWEHEFNGQKVAH